MKLSYDDVKRYIAHINLKKIGSFGQKKIIDTKVLIIGVGVLYDRVHSRLIEDYSGIVNIMPKFSLVFVFSSLANLGLPGTSGFVAFYRWLSFINRRR